MKIIKKENDFGTNVIFDEIKNRLVYSFGGNLDLYWSLYIKDGYENDFDSRSFIITKENYEVYRLFESLFYDIENINLFDEEIPFYIETDEEKQEYLEEYRKKIEEDKKRYRLYNFSNYNELFNLENRTIIWYSDETNKKLANFLTIKDEKDYFKIDFHIQQSIEGYDEDFHNKYYIPVRFRNSGSSYDPFNILFMRMYNNMKEIGDAKEEGHQIHYEEYLYEKEKELIKKLAL